MKQRKLIVAGGLFALLLSGPAGMARAGEPVKGTQTTSKVTIPFEKRTSLNLSILPSTGLKAGVVRGYKTLFRGRVLSSSGTVVLRWSPGSGEILPGRDQRKIRVSGKNNPDNKLTVLLVGNIEGIADPGTSSLRPTGQGEWVHNQYHDNHYLFHGITPEEQTIVADRYLMAVDAAVWNK